MSAPEADRTAVGGPPRTDPSEEEERDAWTVLSAAPGIGPASLAAAVGRAGGACSLLALARRADGGATLRGLLAERSEPDVGPGRSIRDPALVAEALRTAARDAERTREEIEASGLVVLTLLDPGYPVRLRRIETPPPVLFVRGDPRALDPPTAVAVVGTRHPSETGRRIAARLAGAVARAGAVVVSGLAVGIDGAAHAAALAEAAPTVAILGGGHQRLFPRAHARLADAIVAEGGAVASEWGPVVSPVRWSFPRRNRLVSGLSDATVVVEAGERSGALITAAWALEQGRGCYVVPGPIDAPMSRGCLALLRELPDVVRPVVGAEELLDDLGLGDAQGTAPPSDKARGLAEAAGRWVGLGRTEGAVAAALAGGVATVDELVGALGEPVPIVLAALTALEVRGLVVEAYGRYRPAGRLASAGIGSAGKRRRRAPGSTPSG